MLAREHATTDFETGERATVRARRQDHVGAGVVVVAHAHSRRRHELAFTLNNCDATALEESLEALVLLCDDSLAVLRHAGHVDAFKMNLDPNASGLAAHIGDLCGVQKSLRRDASAVEACATDLVFLDQGDRLAKLGGADCGGVAATAAAENDNVEGVIGHGVAFVEGSGSRVRELWQPGSQLTTGPPRAYSCLVGRLICEQCDQ